MGKKQGLTGLAGKYYQICLVKGEKILELAAEARLFMFMLDLDIKYFSHSYGHHKLP